MKTEHVTVVRGPLAPQHEGRVTYSVTLASGHVVTGPDSWPDLESVQRTEPGIESGGSPTGGSGETADNDPGSPG